MMRFVVILSLFLPLLGCDPDVELENIPSDKLLAVTCFISPQDTIFTVYVFKASKIGSTVNPDSAAVKDAVVTISDGTRNDTLQITFEIHPITGRKSYSYTGKRKNITVSTGSVYFLNVQTSSGEVVIASCTIPPAAGSPTLSGLRENDDYRFNISWTNAALHKYFTLILDADGTYENTAPGGEGRSLEIHASLSEVLELPNDGQVIENAYEGVIPKAYIAENPELHVKVRNIDEGLYKYYKSYYRYLEWQSNNSGNLFPNFQEIPLIYSNVNGGAGIFGGYNQSVTTQKIF